MILFRSDSAPTELIVITQSDHARFAAQLLELWRAGGLPEHPRRAELLFAVREHDNGWREADAAPKVSPESGRPLDFVGVSREDRMEIWRRGVLRHQRPYPALLIVHHALRLHAEQRTNPEWLDFFADLESVREELSELSEISPAEIDEDYRWLELADALSLLACRRLGHELIRSEIDHLRARSHGNELILDPLPLAGATTFGVPCRRVPDRRYQRDADLGLALASARWETTEIRVVPGGERLW